MAQTHYSPDPLTWGRDSGARWAMTPVGRAVVFVHGFGGDAQGTWDQFATLLPYQPQCDGRDLLFYGYDSLVQQMPVSAAEFLEFLASLATDPFATVLQPSMTDGRRPDPAFQYQHITIVAHSLGAVVAREALVQAAMETPPASWLERTSLVLFAPAHSGAQIIALADEALSILPARFGALIAGGAKAFAQVLNDIEPGSAALKKLEEDTANLFEQGFTSLRAKVVVIGKKDRIVRAIRFGADPGPKVVPDKGHSGICKPDALYSAPLGYLLPHI
jgi:pimeloyl-ACP methyl ester carboxylesterase